MSVNKALVTFIVITYKEVWDPYMFIGMLKCLKNPNWKAIIYHDGENKDLEQIVKQFNDERITYIESEHRGSWGCYNRIDALKLVDTDFVVQTTIQEYYLPNFIDEIEKNKTNDLIYWPCVHHSFDYNVLLPATTRGRMDWGNFALKTTIARKVGINYPDAYMADGLFIEEVMSSNLVKKQVEVQKILNIKN